MKPTKKRTVLAVDPGSQAIGVCMMRGGKIHELASYKVQGRMKGDKLWYVFKVVNSAAARWKPDVFAVESFFAAMKFPHAAAVVGEVRGVCILAAVTAGVDPANVVEVRPMAAKMAVTGKGNATKDLIRRCVASIWKLERFPTPDEADAAAIAYSVDGSSLPLGHIEGIV